MNNVIRTIFQKKVRRRSEIVVSRVTPYINEIDKIVDIGSGVGDVSFLLKTKGYDVTPVDVADFHGPRLIETTIYNGKTLPFKDKFFDKAMLLMVLHHTHDPELIFSEAARVAREIVIIETSYTAPISKWLTVITDTIGNLRLEAFWKSYKTDKEWRQVFGNHGFEVVESHKYDDRNFGLPFLHISYYLRRKI